MRPEGDFVAVHVLFSSVPKGTLAERLLRLHEGPGTAPAIGNLVPKGTLAERLLRRAGEPRDHGADPAHVRPERDLGRKAIETGPAVGEADTAAQLEVPKGTLAERLLRLSISASVEAPAKNVVPKGTLAERLLRLHVHVHVHVHVSMSMVPKGTLAERLLRRLVAASDSDDVFRASRKGPWPKGY